ncbi:MAG: acyl carrier protein [Bacteroidales bacterium]|jgi:acyl carrier protein
MSKQEIAEKIIGNISDKLGIPKTDISFESPFNSFGVDSLDSVEIIVDMESEFKIRVPDNKLLKLQSVQSIVDYVDDSLNKKFRKKA